MPVGEGADEIDQGASPVPVTFEIARRFDFGDPVDKLQSIAVDGADRVDHHLAMRQPAGTYQAGAREDRLPARDAAPHVDAGIAGLAFVREELLAEDGIDAVAGDRDTALHGASFAAARPIGKCHRDAVLVLRNAETMAIGDEPVAARAFEEGVAQQHLEVAAVDRKMRMLVARY